MVGVVSENSGMSYPVLHVHEHSLRVLAYRYVDKVIIGVHWEVTKDYGTMLGRRVQCSA